MNLEIIKNTIQIGFQYDPVDLIHKTKAAGLVWIPKTGKWTGPANARTAMDLVEQIPDLESELSTLLPKPVDWTPSPYLMAHQKEGARIALTYPRYGFFDDTGTGKTALGIELVRQKGVKTLVVCNLSLIVNAWMSDISKFAPELKVANLWESQRSKAKRIPEHDIAIINYERFRTTHETLTGYEMVLIDESSKCKDPKSQITKALIKYTDQIPYVYLFSGTPAPNNEMEYWSQFRIIDQSLLGRSFYSFRNRFCYSTGFGGYIWKMKNDMKSDFLEKIGTKSRVVRKEDVLDLPERTFNTRTVYLDSKETAAYLKMESDMILEIGDQEVLASTAVVKMMKLRQGTSGFYYDPDGKAIQVGTSKLEALRELLAEIGNHQVLVWYQFRYEGDQIAEMLSHNFGRVDGSITNQKLKDETVQDFMAGKIKYLIAHPASLGHGVTLTNCNYAVYYSLSHSYELQYQSQDRIYRKSQKNACTYYNLVVPKTVDEAILKALDKKADVAEAVFAYLKRNRG